MKTLVFGTQERALSVDVNRLQSFKAADVAEMMRYLIDVGTGTDDLDANGLTAEYLTQENPLRAEIMNGYLVRPQIGSLNLLVDAGVMYAINPDGGSDDSVYKYVRDSGISQQGALAFTDNISGGDIRIDVVEVSLRDAVLETDNRDIFNSVSGLFTAATITKARANRLMYRVRAGTPGAGFPGTSQGWLPLMVASIPDGASTCDTMTFWDVRPLVSDRTIGMATASQDYPVVEQVSYTSNGDSSPTTSLPTNGMVKGVIGSRRVGGILRRGTPGADADSLDVRHADNLEPGFTLPGGQGFFYVYLVTPFGLPRWARYTATLSGGRTPRSPRGILVTSTIIPAHLTGKPLAAIALPDSTGLVGSSSDALCVAAYNHTGTTVRGGIADGKVFFAAESNTSGERDAGFSLSAVSHDSNSALFTMQGGVTHPANAKALYVAFRVFATVDNGEAGVFGAGEIQIYNGANTALAVVQTGGANYFANGTGGTLSSYIQCFSATVRIPVPNNYPASANTAFNISWFYQLLALTGSPTIGSVGGHVIGWEF